VSTVLDGSVAEREAWGAPLPPLAELVAAMADLDRDADAEPLDEAGLDEIRVALAIELALGGGEDSRVRGSTPTQWTETTVMPVFHRLWMRIARPTDA
jgi:hypothetical protein